MFRIRKMGLGILTAILSLSFTLTSQADVNGTGGGDIAQNSNEAYAARYNVYTENQGMRIYLIDNKGNTVSTFIDIVQYRPETIEQGLITTSNSAHETAPYYTALYKAYKGYTGYQKKEKSYLYLSGTKFDSQGGKFNTNLQGNSLKGGKMFTYAQIGAYLDAYYQAEFSTNSPVNSTNNFALPIIRNMGNWSLEGQGEVLKQQFDIPVDNMNILGYLLRMKLPTWDERGNLISQEVEPIISFKSESDKQAAMEKGFLTVVKEKGYWVAIEPIHWAVLEIQWPTCYIEELRGNDLNAFACSNNVVYGTESTVYNYFYTDAKLFWSDKYIINEMYPSWMWGLGKYAFQLKQDDSELNLHTIPSNWDKETNRVDFETLALHSRDIGYGLMLMKTTPENGSQINIVKVFRENGEIIDVKQSTTTTTTVTVSDEDTFTYTESKKTPDSPLVPDSWEDVTGNPITDTEITVDETTKTIYILYDKDNGNTGLSGKQIKLYSNELSYNYSLADLTADNTLFSIYDTIQKASGTKPYCGGHDCGDDNCSGNHTCNNSNKYLSDSTYTVSVKDAFDYNTTTFIRDYSLDNNSLSVTGNTDWDGGTSDSIQPDATYLLYRQKDKDLVTLYPEKNNLDLSSLGISNTSYTPAFTRIEKEAAEEKAFTNTFRTHFEYSSDRDTGLSWVWELSGSYGDHEESGNYNTQTAKSPEDANAAYSQRNNVKTHYFLGKANVGQLDPQDTLDSEFKNFNYNSYQTRKSSVLAFYPYIKMKYNSTGSNSPQDVYVTSENLSTMKVFNAAQIGVRKEKRANINLSSTQWSTHARSLRFLEDNKIKDKKSVLAGGALMDLDTGSKDSTELRIKLFISCLPGNQVQAVQSGFNTSESQAREQIEAYKQEVTQVLKGYCVEQRAATGLVEYHEDMLDADVVESNKKLKWGNTTFTTARDNKYYLKKDGSDSTRANIDVLDVRETSHIYTVSSDTDGNVMVYKDGVELARITATESVSKFYQLEELKLLDDNTKLLSNYVLAIDRNGGSDRENSPWYNEAFDGISVIVTDIRFSLGFGGDKSVRSLVLDPTLTGKADNKKDLYNFNKETLEEKVRTSVFLTSNYSTTTNNRSAGYLGTFKSNDSSMNLQTGITSINSLFHSKLFYIPNATVSDLN